MTKKAALPDDFDAQRLGNQICFPLYAASRLVTRLYQPMLEPLGLTYPQYIVLMILWEDGPSTISAIGRRALLATNTLTPLLKRLEVMGLLERRRNDRDERIVNIHLTAKGRALKKKCACIPQDLFDQVGFSLQDSIALKQQLDKFLSHLQAIDAD